MSSEPLVTISASYGAGGSRVGPLVAERLGVPFAERVLVRHVAERLGDPLAPERRGHEPVGRSLGRWLRQVAAEFSSLPVVAQEGNGRWDDEYRRAHEEEMLDLVPSGGVILGRAAAVVLRDVPHAVHVRMSGPVELRIEQAMRVEVIDRETARWRQATEDFARDRYVRHFYELDPENPDLYHLRLDSARLPLDVCVDTIAAAARSAAG